MHSSCLSGNVVHKTIMPIAPSVACCRSGAQWDKQHGVDVERERLMAHTRDAVAKGLASGNMWHAATNAEHARPMLQVPDLLPVRHVLWCV